MSDRLLAARMFPVRVMLPAVTGPQVRPILASSSPAPRTGRPPGCAPQRPRLTNFRAKSRTERVNVNAAVSGTDRELAPTQLSITYWSGAPLTRA